MVWAECHMCDSIDAEESLKLLTDEIWPIVRNDGFWQAKLCKHCSCFCITALEVVDDIWKISSHLEWESMSTRNTLFETVLQSQDAASPRVGRPFPGVQRCYRWCWTVSLALVTTSHHLFNVSVHVRPPHECSG